MVNEREKLHAAENIWLHFFNRELHKQNLISDFERSAMLLKIENRKPPAKAGKGRRSEHR